ncbi:DNA methyltransferase [Hydrogenoanaerobacterium sp.]|uniref:DNA methyltransferase n=1 Tax=Hydrogenoanaerobacterium sp. TaxID=2953763 RepID=UPI00289E4BD7|nr:DNA methyltransferase [Hydrogenoanaerobacterium sp.]
MEPRKLTKEDIDKVRNIEGFPIASDEDIIALSDAPYYTACPNPFIEEFIRENGTPYDEATDDYHREPFASDVSEGKYDPIYKLHPYHTKVPHKAIMKYIAHYTKPGDIVFDGFCGTGMTGVAAQACGFENDENTMMLKSDLHYVELGHRKAVLVDLASAATSFAHNFNSSIDEKTFFEQSKNIIERITEKCSWMYKTVHVDTNNKPVVGFEGKPIMGLMNYTVWSDVFICPNCGEELIFWKVAVDIENGIVREKFGCPHCSMELKKRDCSHAQEIVFDDILSETITRYKQTPVIISYTVQGKRFEKTPDDSDFALFERIEKEKIQTWVPVVRMIEGNEARRNDAAGITHVHHFYTKRNLIALSYFKSLITANDPLIFALTKVANQLTKLYRFTYMSGCWGAGGGPMSGTLYIPSLVKELNMMSFLEDAINLQGKRTQYKSCEVCISTQSSSDVPGIPDNSIDYIFTDPPFGDNLSYSELNCIWEAWLGVQTNNESEAIINLSHGKHLVEYQTLMEKCFNTCFRVLKPNRWITIEFHNSKNSVWNAIQEALLKSGFIVADVRTLDKKHSSFKQVNSRGTVKQDLVISAYKPEASFIYEFGANAGHDETSWAFVRQHLSNLPKVVVKNGLIEVNQERQAYLLWDRMVAYHIMQGIPVPMDVTDFYQGLDEKFLKRDGMYFLPSQVNEYDTARITSEVEPIQMELLVTNEKAAIGWLYQQLCEEVCGPQTYAQLQPKFMQEVKSVDKFEAMPELAVLLEENFLQDDDGRWYIPDVTKEGDVAKLREKNLWKEFEGYMNSKGKLKLFRSEAVRVGFSRLWKDKNYKAIVDIAERLPEQTIQEDANLLMYYDISCGRI